MRESHQSFCSTKTFYHLIHSGSVQKMLAALFKFGIHRKVHGQFFLSTKARWQKIEMVLVKISEEQL